MGKILQKGGLMGEYGKKLANLLARLFALVLLLALICAPALDTIYGIATHSDKNIIEQAWESETYAEQLMRSIDPDIPGRNRAMLARAAVDAHEKNRCVMGAEVDQAIAKLSKIRAIDYVAELLEDDDELARETHRRLRKAINEPELKEAPVSSITIQGEAGSD